MTHPTITKELAGHDFLKMAVDAMQDAEVEGPRIILGPVALERFAQAIYKLGRNAGLGEAKQLVVKLDGMIVNLQPHEITTSLESLKDNTP